MRGNLSKILDAFPKESFLSADGFETAVIGVEDKSMRLIYSVSKCLEILMEQGMDYIEAVEYFEFNVSGSFMGPQTPIWRWPR